MSCIHSISDFITGSNPGTVINFLFFDENCTGVANGTGTTPPSGLTLSSVIDTTNWIKGKYWFEAVWVDPSDPSCFASTTFAIQVEDQPDAGLSVVLTVCTTDPPLTLFGELGGTPQSTGFWSGDLGSPGYSPLGSSPTDDQFNPAASGIGTFMFTYTVDPVTGNVSPCDNCLQAFATVTINVIDCTMPCDVDAGNNLAYNICQTCSVDMAPGGNPLTGGDTGGVFTQAIGPPVSLVGSVVSFINAAPGGVRF